MKKIVFFGDWHGVGSYAEKTLYRTDRTLDPDIYLHLGDFGFSTYGNYSNRVDTVLKNLGKELWVTPGNHENYDLLKSFPYDNRGLQQVGEKLFVIPRGYSWEWNKVRFASLGGAYSIDRPWRTLGKTYWLEEEITEEDFQKTLQNEDFQVLLSHEAPFFPPGRGDDSLSYKLTRKEKRQSKKGRDKIARIIIEKNVKLNLHGHHHVKYERHLKNCRVIGLDCDGSSLDNNRFMLDLDDFKESLSS